MAAFCVFAGCHGDHWRHTRYRYCLDLIRNGKRLDGDTEFDSTYNVIAGIVQIDKKTAPIMNDGRRRLLDRIGAVLSVGSIRYNDVTGIGELYNERITGG